MASLLNNRHLPNSFGQNSVASYSNSKAQDTNLNSWICFTSESEKEDGSIHGNSIIEEAIHGLIQSTNQPHDAEQTSKGQHEEELHIAIKRLTEELNDLKDEIKLIQFVFKHLMKPVSPNGEEEASEPLTA
jgi:hypothetical protein